MGLSKLVFTTAAGGRIQFKTAGGQNLNFQTTGFSVQPAVRLGDASNHGGTMTSASSIITADGKKVCQNGDIHTCPITGHGATPVSATTTVLKSGAQAVVRVGDKAGCGAILVQGSPSLSSS